MTQKILRLFHTVRYLRWEQIFYRLYARLRFAKIRVKTCPSLRPGFPSFSFSAFAEPSFIEPDTFRFFNESHAVDLQSWDILGCSDLWRYNLHYFDDLNARGTDARFIDHCGLIEQWIRANLPLNHIAWAPYPTSLRLVNWIKWLTRHPEKISDEIVFSIAKQADVLEQRIEYHLLGNHLFENARALVLVGSFLKGVDADRWLATGLRILDHELPEQFLSDGGHFELSPMYQATMLWGFLDLIELAKNHLDPRLHNRFIAWVALFQKSFCWLETMSFPDGEITFFNDAAFGVAPTVTQLRQRAVLTIELPEKNSDRTAVGQFCVTDLNATGYVRVEWDTAVLIADMARIGPDYLPGHAHADTLSFEFALGQDRLFVNSGTSCYGTSVERHRQRGTAAHNTIEVDGENSSEVWSGFRVARRAYPGGRSVIQKMEIVKLTCAHTGYMRLAGKVMHSRKWTCTSRCLVIEDVLSGKFTAAVSRLILHPAWEVVEIERKTVRLVHKNGQTVLVHVEGGFVRTTPFSWHPRFGESFATTSLVINLEAPCLSCSISW